MQSKKYQKRAQAEIRRANLRKIAAKIALKKRMKKVQKKIALMKMGRNEIVNNYLLRKVFVPRYETFGLN